MKPTLPQRGGWSRQPARDTRALHICCVLTLLTIVAVLVAVAIAAP
jgi:hypothetical protein